MHKFPLSADIISFYSVNFPLENQQWGNHRLCLHSVSCVLSEKPDSYDFTWMVMDQTIPDMLKKTKDNLKKPCWIKFRSGSHYYKIHLQKAVKWKIQESIISITHCFYWLLTTDFWRLWLQKWLFAVTSYKWITSKKPGFLIRARAFLSMFQSIGHTFVFTIVSSIPNPLYLTF